MNCQQVLRLKGEPYPRTCQICGLGPCSHSVITLSPSDQIINQIDRIKQLETENAELRKDKERLDWLINSEQHIVASPDNCYYWLSDRFGIFALPRDAIDEAMKGEIK